jgi:hypothetical protein
MCLQMTVQMRQNLCQQKQKKIGFINGYTTS